MTSIDRFAQLSRCLFISGALNIILIVFIIYWMVREKPPTPYYESKPAAKQEQLPPLALDASNAEMLRTLRTLPLEQLIVKLSETQQVENGYTMRDLSLGIMVTLRHFNLQKILGDREQPLQERKIAYGKTPEGKPVEVSVYPGLTDGDFQAIEKYAATEKWPLTTKGLYFGIKKKFFTKEVPDPTLVEAFRLSPEFAAVDMLFTRSQAPLDPNDLVQMLSEGSWSMLTTFTEQQRAVQDLSAARRQKFLLDYIEQGSRAAAYALLKTDPEFALRKLDDRHVLLLLRLLQFNTPEAESYALNQLTSPRSNAVWKLAARRLYQYAGEAPPANYQHHIALERFVQKKTGQIGEQTPIVVVPPAKPITPTPKPAKPLAQSKPAAPPPSKPADKVVAKPVDKTPKILTYKVQEKDSLWKISRKFNVDLEKLKKVNGLTNDRLSPGMTIKIPL